MPRKSDSEVLQEFQGLGAISPADFDARGIPRSRLYRLVRLGLADRVSRGLYVVSDHLPTEHHSLAQAAKRVPQGVICLLSALQFHELTTQLPHQVWLAIPLKARRPKVDYPPLRVVRFSEAALAQGVETYEIEAVSVRVTSVAKTVVDCFKYRNKIGLDVALGALREAWRESRVGMTELDRLARVCRMQRVMRPYLEMLVA